VDPVFAKHQLLLIMREGIEGRMPDTRLRMEISVMSTACTGLGRPAGLPIEKEHTGKGDIGFLKKILLQLRQILTWWINRKDANGNNMFEGGFLRIRQYRPYSPQSPVIQ